jgi:subfamily B ATP-binding cassette protein MsbA
MRPMMRDLVRFSGSLGVSQRAIGVMLFLIVSAVVFEGIGIGMFVPVFELMNSGGLASNVEEKGAMWRALFATFELAGLEPDLGKLLILAFLCLLVRQVFTFLRLTYISKLQYLIIRNVRARAFDSLLEARLAFHDRLRVGELINEMLTELGRAVACLNTVVLLSAQIILSVAYAVILAYLSISMTLMVVAVAVMCSILLRRLLARSIPLANAIVDNNQAVSRFLVERIPLIRLVRLSGLESAERLRMMELLHSQRDKSTKLLRLQAWLSVSVEPIIVAFALVVLYLAVINYSLPVEQILLFFAILIRLLPVIKEIMLSRQSVIANLASVRIVQNRLDSLLASKETHTGTLPFPPFAREIRFENVGFSYQVDATLESGAEPYELRPALSGIDLRIDANRMTALVGPSGSGKSTLVDLLPRLRSCTTGRIYLDDTPLAQIEMDALRRNIAYAPQVPQILGATPLEHIQFGRAGASDAEIEAAARAARAHEFIERLPGGYRHQLGLNGASLSGGQRQRLDLARALVQRAPILILDEPTSSLDAVSEALFKEAIAELLAAGRTTVLMIGHRLSSVVMASRIVVLINGKVAEQGTHDELLASGGWYATAYERQNAPGGVAAEPAAEDRTRPKLPVQG